MHVDISERECQLLEEALDHTLDDLEAQLYTLEPARRGAVEAQDAAMKALLHRIQRQHPMPAHEAESLDGLVGAYRGW